MEKAKHPQMSKGAITLVAARFRVLGEPLRLEILHGLQDGKRSVTELAKAVASTQPNVSKHLKIMQDAGLVGRNQDGNTVYYSIADKSVFRLCDVVCASLRDKLAEQSAALG